MSFYEYWIGKDVNYESLWDDFESGDGYVNKFKSMKVHLLKLSFDNHPTDIPLFDLEVVYKTLKGTFHDIKMDYLSDDEYEAAGPMFVYKIDRGSSEWYLLAELKPLLYYAGILVSAIYAYQKITKQSLENLDKKISILRKYFPGATGKDEQFFIKAKTPWARNKIIQKLIERGLDKVEISKEEFSDDFQKSKSKMIDVKKVFNDD